MCNLHLLVPVRRSFAELAVWQILYVSWEGLGVDMPLSISIKKKCHIDEGRIRVISHESK